MKKTICLLLICVLLLSVPVAASEAPVLTSDIQHTMRSAFWGTYFVSTLPPEVKQEIEGNFLTSMGRNLDIGATEYYGTINGCELFLEMLPLADETYIELAGHTLYWPSLYNVFCYRNGEFLTIQDAYDQGWLAAEHIGTIAYLNKCAISMRIEYYGEYSGCYVGFVHDTGFDYAEAELSVSVADVVFRFQNHQQLTVCKEAQAKDLDDAYEAGWLSDGEVERLWNYYTNGIYEENPNTGDGVWTPVALLVTSGAALVVLSFRKKKI